MDFVESIREQARQHSATIVLPEWDDPRILRAAAFVADAGIATPLLVGDQDTIAKQLKQLGCAHPAIEIVHFDSLRAEYVAIVQEKYKKKQKLNDEQVARLLQDCLHQGALLLDSGICAGMVAGVNRSTADVIKTGIRVIGLDPRYKTASSFFVMLAPAQQGVLIFADCALVVDPTASQLADICLATVANAAQFLDGKPVVAMLSFSTEGSAQHPHAAKVAEATRLTRAAQPQLDILGEVQFDAALSKEVAAVKLRTQQFSQPANVFIFPDLGAGNIGYKICQRLAGYQAIGPVLQGFKLPVNDLSRGASVDDIINLVALTSLQIRDCGL